VLAKGGSLFQVEVVQRNDAIDGDPAREVGNAEDQIVHLPALVLVGDVEHLVDALRRPVCLLQAERRHEQHPRPLALRLAHELEPFVVGRQAEDGQW
jgi:hypothetical protein